jgi:hypothetical protein
MSNPPCHPVRRRQCQRGSAARGRTRSTTGTTAARVNHVKGGFGPERGREATKENQRGQRLGPSRAPKRGCGESRRGTRVTHRPNPSELLPRRAGPPTRNLTRRRRTRFPAWPPSGRKQRPPSQRRQASLKIPAGGSRGLTPLPHASTHADPINHFKKRRPRRPDHS